MVEVVKYLGTFSLGLGVAGFVFLNPEKAQIWASLFWRIVSFFWKKWEYKAVANDIEGRVNHFARRMSKLMCSEIKGVKITWVDDSEDTESFINDNDIVVVMKKYTNQETNFVKAAMVYVSRTLLLQTRRYLSKSQKQSLDLYVANQLFHYEKPQVVDQFYEEIFAPVIDSNEKIAALVEKYNIIDEAGLFFPILVQELRFLGLKVFAQGRNDRIVVEVSELVDFLKNFAQRQIGDESVNLEYKGKFCSCAIVIIAKRQKVEIGKTDPYTRFVEGLVRQGIESIYFVGNENNAPFIKQIAAQVSKVPGLVRYLESGYQARLRQGSEIKSVPSRLVLFRAEKIERYVRRSIELAK